MKIKYLQQDFDVKTETNKNRLVILNIVSSLAISHVRQCDLKLILFLSAKRSK